MADRQPERRHLLSLHPSQLKCGQTVLFHPPENKKGTNCNLDYLALNRERRSSEPLIFISTRYYDLSRDRYLAEIHLIKQNLSALVSVWEK